MSYKDTYAFIQKATDKLNEKLNKEEDATCWKTKAGYDSIVGYLSEIVETEIDTMIDTRFERRLRVQLEEFFKELGFDKAMASAKASDMIAIARRKNLEFD